MMKSVLAGCAVRSVVSRPRRIATAVLEASVVLLAAGCGDKNLAPDPLPADSEVYWELVLSQHAALMSTVAPYDTLKVTATPRNFEHVPLTGLPAPTYTSTKPDKVNVLSDGTVVVVDTTAEPVAIAASLTIRNLKHTDTLRVIAVDSAQPVVLDTFSIHPTAPDSAKTAMGIDRGLSVRALAPGGGMIGVYRQDFPGIVPVSFISQEPEKLQALSSSQDVLRQPPFGFAAGVRGLALGTSTVIASTVVFGVPKADTLAYRIGRQLYFAVGISYGGDPTNGPNAPTNLPYPAVTIGTGGAVSWTVFVSPADTLAVTFDETALPYVAAPASFSLIDALGIRFPLCGFTDCTQSGSFLITGDNASSGRYFPVAGTYEYLFTANSPRSTPTRARVIVVDESDDP